MLELISNLSLGQLLIVAYTGPGAGLTMLGSLLAVLVLFLLALLAPFVYLVRFLIKLYPRSVSDHQSPPPPAESH